MPSRSHAQPSSRTRRGLTLLEAVLSLAILAAVAAVVLGAHADAVTSSARLDEQRRVERETEAIFRMLEMRTLPAPAPDAAGQPVWTGEHLGHPYRITRTLERPQNPAANATPFELGPTVPLYRYTIEYRGESVGFLYNR